MIPTVRRAFERAALLSLLLVVATAHAVARPAPPPDSASVDAQLDALLGPAFKPDAPGGTVIVVKDGKTIYRKAFGLADLELKVPNRPEMVFEIGSVTKQFTSTAILMLVDQGKLSLSDDMRKYLPDFPDKGATITVEHLLTHTSGIPSYTGKPEWRDLWRKDMTPAEIIALTADEPLEFAPGTQFAYDNTGYIILGAIIEKVSGMSYAEFIQKNIFDPLGMTHSYYGSAQAVIPNRADGYTLGRSGWEHAEYLSMTQPYAAGSLMSTVDDLALWDAAVSAGRLLKPESWKRAFTPYTLANGESTRYGYGWGLDNYAGHPIIRHNGGIFGYISEIARFPEDHVYVAMLTNSNSPAFDTGFMATRIGAIAIGKPYIAPTPVAVSTDVLGAYTGVYTIDEKTKRYVTLEDGKLFVKRGDRPKTEIVPMSETEFFIPDSLVRFRFEKDGSGRVTRLVVHQGDGTDEIDTRTDEPLPTGPKAVEVSPAILGAYVGEYTLAPGFVITVTLESGHLMAQATGQPKIESFASSETEFFLKVVDAQITFVRDASGKVEKLILHQAGRDAPAPKTK